MQISPSRSTVSAQPHFGLVRIYNLPPDDTTRQKLNNVVQSHLTRTEGTDPDAKKAVVSIYQQPHGPWSATIQRANLQQEYALNTALKENGFVSIVDQDQPTLIAADYYGNWYQAHQQGYPRFSVRA